MESVVGLVPQPTGRGWPTVCSSPSVTTSPSLPSGGWGDRPGVRGCLEGGRVEGVRGFLTQCHSSLQEGKEAAAPLSSLPGLPALGPAPEGQVGEVIRRVPALLGPGRRQTPRAPLPGQQRHLVAAGPQTPPSNRRCQGISQRSWASRGGAGPRSMAAPRENPGILPA